MNDYNRTPSGTNFFGGCDPSLESEIPSSTQISLPNAAGIQVGGIQKGQSLAQYDNIQDLLNAIFYPYVNPSVSLSTNKTQFTLQKGVDTISALTLTATLTKGTADLQKVEFYQGSTLLSTENYVAGQNTYTCTVPNTLRDTSSFTCKVYDTRLKTGTSSAVTFNFYYPNFSWVTDKEIADITMQDIEMNGAMRLEARQASKTLTYTGNMARYVYAFPASWGNLSSILDSSGYEFINAFQKVNMDYTSGTDTVPMNVYISKNNASLNNYKYTYKI